jgi:hypothetical protein
LVRAGLPIGRGILKSRMNREVHVRFREELGVKLPLLTRLAAVFLSNAKQKIMGVDTKAIIRKGETVTDLKEAIEKKYSDVDVHSTRENWFFNICFNDGKDKRSMYVSYSGSCLSDYGIDGIWLSLGCYGNSVEIMLYLCETFGGYLDENDCDEDGFYPINFHLYQNEKKEFSEMDLFTNKVISQLGYKNLQTALQDD